MPVFLQNLACSYYGWKERKVRLGKAFEKHYSFLLRSELTSAGEIKAYQDEQVAKLVLHAYHNVPYYGRIMNERGLKPTDIVSREDLPKLPVLTKEDVINNYTALQSVKKPRSCIRKKSTSGTTGKALSFLTTEDAISFQWAVWWRHRNRFSVYPKDLHLNFTGKLIAPATQNKPPYWRWNWPMRQVLLNMQHVTPNKIDDLVGFVNKHNFKFYSGYPSIIAHFCSVIEEQGLKVHKQPKYLFFGAENMHQFQRDTIKRVLPDTHISDQYGITEGCANASRCENDNYHEDWEYSILEYESPNYHKDGSLSGKIIATGFSNYFFPFIRYEVGDVLTWENDSYICDCGRSSRVIRSIQGRDEDYILTPEGNKIMRFDYIFKDTSEIKEAQIIQKEYDSIIVRYVLRGHPRKNLEQVLKNNISNWISPAIKVYFDVVCDIPRSPSGKFKPVVSDIKSHTK